MSQTRLLASRRTRWRFSGRKRGAVVCGLVLAAFPFAARADSVVIPDPSAEAEQVELAGALGLLVRSYIKPGARPLVPRRELGLAMEALTGRPPPKNLTVPSDLAGKLMDRLAADGMVLWDLDTSKKGVVVSGTMLGRGGKRLLRISAAAATGDVSVLAAQLAKKIAPMIGATLAEMPDVGMADLRPFVAAQAAQVAGDATQAARATELALPGVVARVPAAKEVLRAVAEDASLPAGPRAQARLLRGELDQAAELADAGLAKEPKNVMLRALRVRALAGLKNFTAADEELALLKGTRNFTALALAQVALALERDDAQARKDQALEPLLGRPASEWRPLLPIIAATPAGTFGARIEAAALAAAEKLASQEPGLASTLAARALAGGAGARATAGMIRVQELSAEQIKLLSAKLTAEADSSAVGLSQQIKARQEEAQAIEAEAGPQRPTGPPSTLAKNLLPLLQAFDALYEPSLTSIQIAPLPGSGQPFYWPFLVRKQNLAEGLLEALMRSPWELRASMAKIDSEALPESHFTDEKIASLAHDLGASALMLYRISPAGLAPWVKVELILYDGGSQRVDRAEASLIGRSTGLVIINPLIIAICVLAMLALLAYAVVLSMRGAIQVRVQWDSDAKDEMFSILISKTQHTPTIENPTAYRKKMEWIGKRKRRFEAWNIEQNTVFRGIPRGKWYVHLYGVFVRGRQLMLLHEPPQEAVVTPRRTTFVGHVLEAAEAEFKIKVIDDTGPVEGARVWLDEDRGKPLATGKDGCISYKVPKGYHVIHVVARGMNVERPYQVVKAKLHEFTINLVWEKRQEYVSRALERQVDDAEQYMAKSQRRTGAFALQGAPGASSGNLPAQPGAAGSGSHPRVATPVAPAPAAPGTRPRVATPVAPVPAVAPGTRPRMPTPVAPQPSAAKARTQPRMPTPVAPPAQAPAPDSEIVDLTPAPSASAPATAGAPSARQTAVARAPVSLKPLAPQPAQARRATGQQATTAPAAPEDAAPTAEVPLDLDMSGAILGQPPVPGTPRKPGR